MDATARALARPPLRIRRGTVRDVPTILSLIRGLAEYERLSHEARATRTALRRHGFGRRPYFETLICDRGRTAIG
ncbi:MAG: GNAT family N-acetyltransferase, partial [Candidatus Rokuibacteriota bacterium]